MNSTWIEPINERGGNWEFLFCKIQYQVRVWGFIRQDFPAHRKADMDKLIPSVLRICPFISLVKTMILDLAILENLDFLYLSKICVFLNFQGTVCPESVY